MARFDRLGRMLPGLLGAAAIIGLTAAWPLQAQTPIQQGGPPDILGKPSGTATQAKPAAMAPGQTGKAPAAAAQPGLAPATVATPSADGAPDRTRIAISEELKTDLPQGTAAQKIKGRFADVVRVTDPRLRDQVNVEGTVRYEPIPGDSGKRAVITWNQVVRTDQTDKKKAFSSPLVSSFKPLQSTVTPGVSLTAQGDVNAAIAAAQALFAEKEEKKEEAKPTTNTQQPQQQQQARNAGGAASNQPKNDMLRSIEVPNGSGITVTPEKDDVVGTTSEGCPVRIDLAQGVAIKQSRVTTNGTPTGDCSDTEVRYQIQRSYVGCEDLVKKDEKKAFAQFRNFFMSDDGTTSYIGEACQQDVDSAFALVEDPASCTAETNLADMKAYKRSELTYLNRLGQRVVVEGCRRTPDTPPADMTRTTEGCAIRHDFTGGVSFQQKKVVYVDGQGAMFQVSACSDTEDSADRFVHSRDFSACEASINLATLQAIPQFRIAIQPPSGKAYISECAPDPSAAVTVSETTEGCETVFFHDMPAGQSFGASRFRYLGQGGSWIWVNESCQKSTKTYPHQLETQGYEHHDDQRYSYAKEAIYINAPGGRVDVSPAMVRAGAAQLPYTLTGTANVPRSEGATYEGCNKYVQTDATETYKRADNTVYNYVVGAGPTQGPTDVCVTTVIDSRVLTTGSWRRHDWGAQCYTGEAYSTIVTTRTGIYTGTVNKTQKKNQETGTVIANSCAFAGPWNQNSYQQTSDGGVCAGGYGTPGDFQSLSVPPCPF